MTIALSADRSLRELTELGDKMCARSSNASAASVKCASSVVSIARSTYGSTAERLAAYQISISQFDKPRTSER
jgi:hypothetical protein